MAINFEDQKFKDLGIEGAVQIAGRPEIFTIGTGGGGIREGQTAPGAETPESYQQKFGTLETEGIVTEISPEQAAEYGIDISFMTPQEETLDVGDIDEEVPTDVLEEGADQFDISRIMGERQKERTALLEAMSPTEAETTISEELIEKQSEIEKEKIGLTGEQLALRGQGRGITTGLIRGQQKLLEEQSLIRQQTMMSEERTLISRLGLEQAKRKGIIDVAKTMLGFTSEDVDMAFKIQDKLDKDKADLEKRTEKLSDDAKAEMDSILAMFEGMDYEDLNETEQQQILDLANTAGIDPNLLIKGMKNQKDIFLYERQQAAKKAAGTGRAGGVTGFTPTQKLKLEQAGLSGADRQTQLDFLYGGGVELTGLALDIDEAAQEFIDLRAGLGREPTSDQYWSLVNEFAKYSEMSVEDADRVIINRIMEKEGRIPITPQAIEESNLGSDFITEPEIAVGKLVEEGAKPEEAIVLVGEERERMIKELMKINNQTREEVIAFLKESGKIKPSVIKAAK